MRYAKESKNKFLRNICILLIAFWGFTALEACGSQQNNYPLNVKSSSERMLETIRFLSSEKLTGRGIGTPGIEIAADFIAKRFNDLGLEPGGDAGGSYFQMWKDNENKITMKNVIGVIRGVHPILSNQNIVIGAHYDHLGVDASGNFYPGADDNASGVAVLLELAEIFRNNLPPKRNIIFVAFTGEEKKRKGSSYYLDNYKRYPAKNCVGMLNLDTVGRLRENKLFIIGANSAKEWLDILRKICYKINIKIELVAEELNSSDQMSFHERGIPAIQLFTGPHMDYHRITDTPDKINPEGLLKITYIAEEIIEYLANNENPLTKTLEQIRQPVDSNKIERKVSLGVIPDFSYKLKGVRLEGVIPNSPAELCGMKKGDIIVKINDRPINDLQELSHSLKSLKPGESVYITYIRDGEEKTVKTNVVQR